MRNVVEANRAHSDHGGGIYVSSEGAAEMHGNVITGNYAPTNGSGVFWDEGAKGTMREDLLFANGCPSEARSGTAVYVDGGAAPSIVTLDHVTIAEHTCGYEAPAGAAILVEASSKVTVKDSILWKNSSEFQTIDKATFTIQNSITTVSGNGNRSGDPQFVDPAAGDFHLEPGSSAIGTASNKTNAGVYPK
jgi:hypothetical protein